jgi:hypothetical protein
MHSHISSERTSGINDRHLSGKPVYEALAVQWQVEATPLARRESNMQFALSEPPSERGHDVIHFRDTKYSPDIAGLCDRLPVSYVGAGT